MPHRLRIHGHHRHDRLLSTFWALCGTTVVVALIVAAVADFDPSEAVGATAAVLAIAALWLAHSWSVLWRDERRR